MPKVKLIITGSLGFIPSNLIRFLLKEKNNFEIVSIDKALKSESLYNIYVNKSHNFYLGDIADNHFIDTVFKIEQPDVVLHMAALTHVDESIQNADPFIYSNVLGTQVIVNNCIKHKVHKIVYASTDEVMGHLLSENERPWIEDDLPNPRNPYSASKFMGEIIIKAAHETYGLNYNIFRSCNNFGPRQDKSKLIPKVIKCILENKPIPIYGKGAQIREWIYVLDNCSAILKIIKEAPPNEIYNISTGNELSNLELVQQICNVIGKGHQNITFVPDRLGHDFRYAINSDKLRKLGWEPQFKFKKALEHCVNWYHNNQWYLRD